MGRRPSSHAPNLHNERPRCSFPPPRCCATISSSNSHRSHSRWYRSPNSLNSTLLHLLRDAPSVHQTTSTSPRSFFRQLQPSSPRPPLSSLHPFCYPASQSRPPLFPPQRPRYLRRLRVQVKQLLSSVLPMSLLVFKRFMTWYSGGGQQEHVTSFRHRGHDA